MSKTRNKSNPALTDRDVLAQWIDRSQARHKQPDASASALEAALGRIQASPGVYGGARPCALAWVLEFVQDDVFRYSYGTLVNRWWECLRFGRDAGVGSLEERVSTLEIENPFPLRGPGEYTKGQNGEIVIDDTKSRQELTGLQAEARFMVQGYVGTGTIGTGAMPVSFRAARDKPGLWAVVSNEKAAFLFQLMHLLADLGPRIRQCSFCQRFVLAGRTDKRYCSSPCQAKAYKRDHATASLKRKQKRGQTTQKGGKHGTTR